MNWESLFVGDFMSNYQVDICHIQTSDLNTLSSKETIGLIKKYKETKDNSIKEEIIFGNLKLILSIVSRYKQDEMDDLFQVGCIGLIKAIEQFDTNLNVMFSTYAVPLIIGEIKAYNRSKSLFHVSRSMRDLSYKISQIKEDYLKKHHKEISKKQLIQTFNITSYDLYRIETLNTQPSSLSEPKSNQESITLSEVLEDQKADLKLIHEKICLDTALKSLSKKDAWLINQRYFCGKTQIEIADEMNISQAQISRMEKRILKHLKNFFI